MVSFFKKTACIVGKSISKNALLSVLSETSEGAYLEEVGQENWEIASYDVRTREVCVDLISNNGTRRLSIVIPSLRFGD